LRQRSPRFFHQRLFFGQELRFLSQIEKFAGPRLIARRRQNDSVISGAWHPGIRLDEIGARGAVFFAGERIDGTHAVLFAQQGLGGAERGTDRLHRLAVGPRVGIAACGHGHLEHGLSLLGGARDIKVVSADEAKACNFAITASYSRWKEVATEKLDATRGMLQGKLKLKGDLPTIVRYTKAAQELTKATTRVPVEWPDEN